MKKQYLHIIDYLKAVSIIMVIITHYAWTNKEGPVFVWIIAMAVPIFMLLTSYNFTMSFERRDVATIKGLYSPHSVMPRLVRFIIPYLIVFCMGLIFSNAFGKSSGLPDNLWDFATRAIGPGSYYVPILIQLVFVFPIIYLLVRRFKWGGVIIVAAANFIFEFLVWYANMPKAAYRVLLFRYLLYLAFGCFMYFHLKEYWAQKEAGEKGKKLWLIMPILFVIGAGFLLYSYRPGNHWREYHVFFYWTKTCMMSACYIFPIVFGILKYGRNEKLPKGLHSLFSEIGKASYHIFLVQMLYFAFFDDIIFPKGPAGLICLGNLAISIAIGYVFYRFENPYLSGKIANIFKDDRKKRGTQ